jgi:hypothetical protein
LDAGNSPYNLTGNVLVNNGAILFIQAGTTVNLGSYYLEVNGTLQAIGYGANSITFNGGQITFTQYSTNWNESSSAGCIIQNANLTSDLTLSNSAKISSNSIYGQITTSDYTNEYAESIISNNIIEGGVVLEGQDLVLNNTILNQGITIWSTNATVSDNIISGSSAGITDYTDFWDNSNPDAWNNCTALIQSNLILNNSYGIELKEQQGSKPNSPVIINNTITNNTVGIYITWIGLAAPQPEILNNNIYGNSNYNIEISVPTDENATYNWWGTNSTQQISQTIYDYYDDFNLGIVTYAPFLTAPNTDAPTYVNASTGFGGSITPSGIIRVNYGDNQSFTIKPNTGYYTTEVYVNGTSVGAVSSYFVQNINGATTISATFAPNPTPTPKPTPSPTTSPTPTPSPTASPTPTPTAPSTSTATSAPTPSPTASPKATPTSLATAQSTPSPKPTVPEFPTLIIPPILAGTILLSIVFVRKRILKNRSIKSF